jgi:acetyltransferase
MSLHTLDQLFAPRSVTVIGASAAEGSVGYVVLRNLLAGGFAGPVLPVNPHHREICGALAYPDVAHLPETPDLALVCTPPETVPAVIEAVGARGIGAAIVVTAGLSRTVLADGTSAQEAMVVAARRHGTRILGPNCLGLIVPRIGLNASFAHVTAPTGSVAFVSQSGALATAVLDWARPRGIGFSCFVSLGDCADIGFGDVLDALGSDPNTRAILLYIESITSRRGFMSAARAAARNKPVVAVKAGRFADGMRAAQSHTGAMAGSDEVYDAALRRAGILRVFSVEEMFEAVETLARVRQPRGDRLGIVTNGGGIGVMAVDQLIEDGGHLAVLSPATLDRLNSVLPVTWSHGNPVDLVGDANGARYAEAMRILVRAPEVDGLLVMHAPTAVADSTGVAQAVADAVRDVSSPVLTSWVGGEAVAPARSLFAQAGIPTFDTPEAAIRAFLQLIQYRRNQQTLMETPPSVPTQFTVSSTAARAVVNEALARITDPAAGTTLDERQSKAILAAYGIPTVDTHIALTPSEAALKARAIGFPVALKILADGVTHKSDVGGVDLFLDSESTVEHAAERMLRVVAARAPHARVLGFTVQPMVTRTGAHELILGIATDPVFGPVILFGQGGTAVEAIADRSIELPPLNLNLARDLVSRTRVARLLRGARGHVPIDMHALGLALMQVAQMVVDIPDIVEMDINPLLASDKGVLALDARIHIVAATGDVASRLSIRPYPRELEEPFALASGRPVLLRPIRPEDEPEHYAFISKLTPSDVRFRFFDTVRDVPHSEMARFTQIDYDREMAFIATAERDGGNETLGVVRVMTDPDNHRAEFAVVVRSDLSGQGLGHRLLDKMIAYCRSRGTRTLVGQVTADNTRMLELASNLGFSRRAISGEGVVEVALDLPTSARTA